MYLFCCSTHSTGHQCFPCKGVLAAQQDEGLCWIQQTAEASAPGSLQSGGRRTLFFPSPKQQMSCRPSSPQPLPHAVLTAGRGGKQRSTKHPHPGTSARAPRTKGHCRMGSPGTQQHPATSHMRELLGWRTALEGANAFASLSFWCSPATQWGYGHCVLNYLDGSQKPKSPCACGSSMPCVGLCQRW